LVGVAHVGAGVLDELRPRGVGVDGEGVGEGAAVLLNALLGGEAGCLPPSVAVAVHVGEVPLELGDRLLGGLDAAALAVHGALLPALGLAGGVGFGELGLDVRAE